MRTLPLRALVAAVLSAASFASAARAADVDIALVRLGVGSHARAGDMTAALVRVTSGLQAPVQARIEWLVRNADGDVARYARDAALAPGAPTERWLYGVLPIMSAAAQSSIDLVTTVRVVETEDGRTVRVLGERRIDGTVGEDPTVPVETTESLIGVIGDGRAGLAGLSTPTPNLPFIASMNELTKIARGIAPSELPDRWEGLISFETILWTNAPVQNIGLEQARALLDWVRRGGNLVIVLPESGDPWGIAGQRGRTPFGEALPERAARIDAVPVRELLPALSRGGALRNDGARTAVWTFEEDPGNGFVPVVLAPGRANERSGNVVTGEGVGGKPIVVRRPLGFGHVTVVGVDVDGLDRRALLAEGLPATDQFWNRILGRRADTPTPTEWAALAEAKRLETRGGLVVTGRGGELVNEFVGLQSQAALGVLGLLGAFAAYWALAGPGSHYLLRASGRQQYAWLGFLGVATAATAIAWIATGVFELTSARVQHLTFLDRIESPGAGAQERSIARAQGWMGAALPGYGLSRVALGRTDGAAGGNLLTTWFPPPAGNQSGFPDSESYLVPAGSPGEYDLPSRATATVLATHWMGTPSPAWDGTPREMPERRLRQDVTWGATPTIVLHGALLHTLPGPLRDVRIVHVTPFHTAPRRTTTDAPPLIAPSDSMPSFVRMVGMAQWDPNQPLDVGPALYADEGDPSRAPKPAPVRAMGQASAAAAIKQLYYDAVLASPGALLDAGAAIGGDARLQILQVYGMLQPPDYVVDKDRGGGNWRGDAVRVERDIGRGVDLSRWFSTPCLIVVGTLEESGSGAGLPFPFTVDGDEPRADGRTVVRVVFPLPSLPGAMLPPPAR
jgi:hypothetical protein